MIINKKITSLLFASAYIFTILTTTIVPVAGAAGEVYYEILLEGFEGENTWTVDGADTSEIVADTYHGGSHSMKATAETKKLVKVYKTLSQTVPEVAHTFKAYVKTQGAPTDAEANLRLYDGTYRLAVSGKLTGNISGWTEIAVSFIPTSENGVRAELVWSGKGTIYWDDVSVTFPMEPPLPRSELYKPQTQTEMAVDGGFEQVNADGTPKNWGMTARDGATLSTTDEYVYAGSHALVVTNTKAQHVPVSAKVSVAGFEKGATYRISAMVFAPCKNHDDAAIYMEPCRNDPDNPRQLIRYAPVRSGDNNGPTQANRWEEVSMEFVPVENCFAFVYAYPMASGVFYYDDFSIQKIREPNIATMETSEVFYYTDMAEGKILGSVNTEKYANWRTYKVEYEIRNAEGKVLQTVENTVFNDVDFTLSFDLTPLPQSRESYTAKVTIKDYYGEVLQEETLSFYKAYERPSMLQKDGTLVVDGKPFMPVVGYHPVEGKIEEYRDEMGINTLQIGHGFVETPQMLIAELDKLAAKGMKGIVSLFYHNINAADPLNEDMAKAAVIASRTHPAVLAYAYQDEPCGKGESTELMAKAYRLIRDLDTVHPVFTVDMNPGLFKKLEKYTDMMAIDSYPYHYQEPAIYLYQCTTTANQCAKDSGKHVIPIMQLFQGINSSYFPGYSDMRNMMYQSFLAGAKGIGFYALSDKYNGEYVTNTPAGDSIKDWAAAEKRVIEHHFVHGEGNVIADAQDENMHYFIWDVNGETYIIVRNKTNAAKTAQIPFTGDGAEILCGAEKREIAAADGQLSFTLQPREVLLCRKLRNDNSIIFTKQNVVVTAVYEGEMVVRLNRALQEGESFIVALYEVTEGAKRLMNLTKHNTRSASLTIPKEGKYEAKAFCLRLDSLQPQMDAAFVK